MRPNEHPLLPAATSEDLRTSEVGHRQPAKRKKQEAKRSSQIIVSIVRGRAKHRYETQLGIAIQAILCHDLALDAHLFERPHTARIITTFDLAQASLFFILFFSFS